MTRDVPTEHALAMRLQMLSQRLEDLEARVRGLIDNQTVEAKALVIRDEGGAIRARVAVQGNAPWLTFYDASGTARLQIGLCTDGAPSIQVDQQEMVPRHVGTDK